MSLFSEINRIKGLKKVIRAKLISLGLVSDTADLDECKTAIVDIKNNGAVSETLTTNGASYAVPKGYHNGNGQISALITNLFPENVKKGVTVGGVTGECTGNSYPYEMYTMSKYYSSAETLTLIHNLGKFARFVIAYNSLYKVMIAYTHYDGDDYAFVHLGIDGTDGYKSIKSTQTENEIVFINEGILNTTSKFKPGTYKFYIVCRN